MSDEEKPGLLSRNWDSFTDTLNTVDKDMWSAVDDYKAGAISPVEYGAEMIGHTARTALAIPEHLFLAAADAVVPGTPLEDVAHWAMNTETGQEFLGAWGKLSAQDQRRIAAGSALVEWLPLFKGFQKAANATLRNTQTLVPGFYSKFLGRKAEGFARSLSKGAQNAFIESVSPSARAMADLGIPKGLQEELLDNILAVKFGKSAYEKIKAKQDLTPEEKSAWKFLQDASPTQNTAKMGLDSREDWWYVLKNMGVREALDLQWEGGVRGPSQMAGLHTKMEGPLVAKMYMLKQMGLDPGVLDDLSKYVFGSPMRTLDQAGEWGNDVFGGADSTLRQNAGAPLVDNLQNNLASRMVRESAGGGVWEDTLGRVVPTQVLPSQASQLPQNQFVITREPKSSINIANEIDKKYGTGFKVLADNDWSFLDDQGIEDFWKVAATTDEAGASDFLTLQRRKNSGDVLLPKEAETLETLKGKRSLTDKQAAKVAELEQRIQTGTLNPQQEAKYTTYLQKSQEAKNFPVYVNKQPDGTYLLKGSHLSGATELGGTGDLIAWDPSTNKAIAINYDRHDLLGLDPVGGKGLYTVSKPIYMDYSGQGGRNTKGARIPLVYSSVDDSAGRQSLVGARQQKTPLYEAQQERMLAGRRAVQERTGYGLPQPQDVVLGANENLNVLGNIVQNPPSPQGKHYGQAALGMLTQTAIPGAATALEIRERLREND